MLLVVDSSGWIAFFLEDPNFEAFAPAIRKADTLIVPTVVLNEVFRWVAREDSVTAAHKAVDSMRLGRVIPLDDKLSILSAELGLLHRLPLADSIIYATAQHLGAELLTQDADFEGLPGVRYIPHPDREK